jgi:hypothetical protein
VSPEKVLELLVFLALAGSGFYLFRGALLLHRDVTWTGKDVSFLSIAINYAVGFGLLFAAMLALAGILDKAHVWDVHGVVGSIAFSIIAGLVVLVGSFLNFASR